MSLSRGEEGVSHTFDRETCAANPSEVPSQMRQPECSIEAFATRDAVSPCR